MTTQHLQTLDKQHVWHPFTHMSLWLADDPLVIVAGDGMHLIDSDGRRYLDAISSLWCNVHGHRVKEIDDAVRAQLDRIAHCTMLGQTNDQAIILAERLIAIAPRGLAKVFYSDSGATATEIAFKMAAQYWWNLGRPQKHEFIGLTDGYHGDTVGAMSVGMTAAFHKPYRPLLFKVHYAPAPFPYRYPVPGDCGVHALAAIEEILKAHHQTIAAICIEPIVMGAAGMIVHPHGFLTGVRALADKYDVLLICDEVATGFGRTGTMFACEHENVTPDILCLAKGLTGGYMPLAATLATQRIFDAFLGEPHEGKTFFHGHTYTGNPLACAAAIASLDLFDKNDLIASVRRKSLELTELLSCVNELEHVGDVRQKGFMVGIELVADKASKRPFDPKQRVGAAVCRRVRDRGIIVRPLGDTIVIFPPLATELIQLREIVDAVYAEIARIGELPSVSDRGDDQIAGDF
ncbi:MAG: adenosylmethionine--8-amino-7-oxononanoate transaminase [Burkholderiales bacterium]|nr:adenosylmethionine--8-amino-7-oxononanoate transaminase [Phycisphaerae bacterium]